MTILAYHGTEHAFDRFDARQIGRMTGSDTRGFWFTSDRNAADYYHSGTECGGRVITARLTMENPLEVTAEQFAASYPHGPPWHVERAILAGHDGLILRQIVDGDTRADVFCVWDAEQIEIVSTV
jgi:hypothetical protein